MLPGVYPSRQKNGTEYYRASLTCRRKHISLGSYDSEEKAHRAYREARAILAEAKRRVEDYSASEFLLPFEKVVSLLNFRDNGLYFKTPIYLRANYFEYYLTSEIVLKFDIDDLFFYSSHKIQKRGNHLFVSEYGMQTGILTRYGIKGYAIAGIDYLFANGDPTDYRYSNILIQNAYYGVESVTEGTAPRFRAKIHINGNYLIGTYRTREEAAIAYNKAVDLAKTAGIGKAFRQNFIESLSAKEYAAIYTELPVSKKYLDYLKTFR